MILLKKVRKREKGEFHMKKILAILLCFTSISLVACTKGEAPSASNVSSTESVTSAQPVESEIEEEMTINTALVQQIGKTNATVKELYPNKECMAEGTGKGNVILIYYEPYIEYSFALPEVGITNFPEGYTGMMEDVYFEENPLSDDIKVMMIFLETEYDPVDNVVTNQDSIRQLFQTDGEITYEKISELLGQAPELAESTFWHVTYAQFSPRTHGTFEVSDYKNQRYIGEFFIENVPVEVTFIKNNDKYIVYSLSIGEVTDTVPAERNMGQTRS